MMKAKAVCVMRTDLRNSDGFKVPKGKLIAQGGHAFVGLVLKLMEHSNYYPEESNRKFSNHTLITEKGTAIDEWLVGKFTKIVLAVDSEEELREIYISALAAGLNTVLITDNGETEFGKPTVTCVGIGPAWSEDIDKITGHLKGFS
jgi:PTH2 family peptidyl-tRNA hydrolase